MSRAKVRIVREIKFPLPKMFWELIFYSVERVLRKKLAPLTIIFVSLGKSRALNARYRKKTTPANVLSFVEEREIIIAPQVVQKEARTHSFSYKYWMTRLIVHGIVHLEGYDHIRAGKRGVMERFEQKILVELGYVEGERKVKK